MGIWSLEHSAFAFGNKALVNPKRYQKSVFPRFAAQPRDYRLGDLEPQLNRILIKITKPCLLRLQLCA